MPSVTLTLTDTPTGQVAIQHDFKPAIGAPCSPAQAAALDVINRTRKDYGLPDPNQADGGFIIRKDLADEMKKAFKS